MLKIPYKQKANMGITPCPYGFKVLMYRKMVVAKVGSIACNECKAHCEQDYETQFVKCNMEDK